MNPQSSSSEPSYINADADLRRLDWRFWIPALLALALVGASMAECVWPDRAQDDAFITYRYARNLATGRGFVYNEGERVLGTTTPLYAMILAAGAAAGASIPEFSSALQIASAMALGGLILLHFRRIDRPGMGVAAMVFFALDRQALGQAIGMESALYAATIFGVFAALAGRRRALAALLCAPTTLLRPDGFLVYIALAVGLAGEKDREELLNDGKLFGALALSVATVGTWHALAWGYFGQPFPQSMAAKAAQSLEADRAKFLGRLFERFVFGPDGWRIRPLGLLALAGAADAVWRYPLTRPTFAWMACYIGLFSLAPDYAWYHFPLAAGVALAGGHGLIAAERIFRRRLSPAQTALAAGALAALCLARPMLISGRLTAEYLRYPEELRNAHFAYAQAGDWLRENAPENASAGALEIGLIGWRSERRIVDLLGLVSPAMLAEAARTPSTIDRLLIAGPEYYVHPRLEPGFDVEKTFGAEFAGAYEKVWEAPFWHFLARDASGEPLAVETRTAIFRKKAGEG